MFLEENLHSWSNGSSYLEYQTLNSNLTQILVVEKWILTHVTELSIKKIYVLYCFILHPLPFFPPSPPPPPTQHQKKKK